MVLLAALTERAFWADLDPLKAENISFYVHPCLALCSASVEPSHSQQTFMEHPVEPSARPVGLVKWYETVWQRHIHRKPFSSGQPCKRGFGKTSGLA